MNKFIKNAGLKGSVAIAIVAFAVLPFAAKADDFEDFTTATPVDYGGGYDTYTTATPVDYGGYDTYTTATPLDYGYGDYSSGYPGSGYSTGGYSTGGFMTGGGFGFSGSSFIPVQSAPSFTNVNTNVNTNTNTCTNGSCNTNINQPTTVTVSNPPAQNIVYNNPPIVYNNPPVYQQPPVYYNQQPNYNTCNTCGCLGYPVCQYQNPTPYVTLSQVPYTGLDLGFWGTIAYWGFLVLWCLVAAYLIIVKRVQNRIFRAMKNFLFGTNIPAPAAEVASGSVFSLSQHDLAVIAEQLSSLMGAGTPNLATSNGAPVMAKKEDATDDFILSQIHRPMR